MASALAIVPSKGVSCEGQAVPHHLALDGPREVQTFS
jgi:hypothetical protein